MITTYDYDYDYTDIYFDGGRNQLDWCFGDSGKSPIQSPYSFDAHYLWRDFDKADIPDHNSAYSDQMNQWDHEKYMAAFDRKSTKFGKLSGRGLMGLSKSDALIITKRYWGEDTKCIGYALDCNRSSGYELGIFFTATTKCDQ